MFRSIKTEMIAIDVVTAVVVFVDGPQGGKEMPYQEFTSTKTSQFCGFKDPISSTRWVADIEGCFYTCSFLEIQNFKFALNLLPTREKDWWGLASKAFSPTEKITVTWEPFTNMFTMEYVP